MTLAVPHRLSAGSGTGSRPGVYLGLAALAAAAFLAAVWSEPLRILLKWLVDPLLHTTSAGGVFLALAVTVSVALVMALGARSAAALRRPVARAAAATLIGAIIVGHACVLAAQIAYTQDVGMPATLPAYHWNGFDNTYTFLLHSHVGKALLTGFDPEIAHLPGLYDTGRALRGAVVPWLVPVTFVAVVSGAVAALALLPEIARRHDRRWAFVWVYAFCAVNCLKTIPDGGPLTYRFLPSFACLVLLLIATDTTHFARIARRVVVPGLALVALYLVLWRTVSEDDYGSAFVGLVFVLVGIVAPLLATWKPRGAARRRLRSGALAIAIAYVGSVYASEASTGTAMLLHPLPAGYRYAVVDLRGPAVLAAGPVPVGTLPADLYRRYGNDPLKPRNVFIWADAGGPQGTMSFGVRFLDAVETPATPPVGSPVRILGATRTPDPTRAIVTLRGEDGAVPPYFSDTPNLLSRNNHYVHLHLAAALLRGTGLTEFVMAPLLNARDLHRFEGRDVPALAELGATVR